MKKTLGMLLLFVGASSAALAYSSVPEIDPATGGSVIALITGALLIVRSRRK